MSPASDGSRASTTGRSRHRNPAGTSGSRYRSLVTPPELMGPGYGDGRLGRMPASQSTGHVDAAVVGLGLIGSGALAALARERVTCAGIGPAEPLDWARHAGPF